MKSKHLGPLLIFAFFSLIMTYPLVFHMDDHVPSDLGDPLYTIWVLSWTSHSIGSGFEGLWDANNFYPHQKTLLFADHIFGLSILAAPLAGLTGNFIFSYNFLFILSFFLCASGMYALIYHLTGSQAAAVIGGLIFAFFPYRYAHISHLEILFFAWMAFLFLFLHRFFQDPSIKNMLGVGVFYVLQVLCCGYYGVFITLFTGLFIVFYTWTTRSFQKTGFWVRISLLALTCFLILIPFYFPYISVHRTLAFERRIREVIHYSAQLQHFLSVPHWNVVWGRLMGTEGGHEWQLYPGAITLLLVAFCFIKTKASILKEKKRKSHKTFYVITAALAFVLSLGPVIRFLDREIITGPYMIFYKWIPGFSSLRVPSRLLVVMMLAMSVLSGYGTVRLLERVPGAMRKRILTVFIGGLILVDFASLPLPLTGIEKGDNIPAVYSTVKTLPNDVALIELPMPNLGVGRAYDSIYMYYSTFHWKPIVNGYCGYNPPGYLIVRDAMEVFPSAGTFDLLRDLDVQYVLVHTHGFRQEKGQEILQRLQGFSEQAQLIDDKNGDYLFCILPKEDKPQEFLRVVERKEDWTATSSSNLEQASAAIDGDPATGWSTAQPLKDGDYFQLDIKSAQEVGKIELFTADKPLCYPRGYLLQGSLDGTIWTTLAENPDSFPRITRQTIDRFYEYRMDITFEPHPLRFLRIRQTGWHPSRRWWIHEIVLKH